MPPLLPRRSPSLRSLCRPLAAVLALVGAHANAQRAVEPAAPAGPASPASIPPDPTVDQAYGCYLWGSYAWNDGSGTGVVQGRIYWPKVCGGPSNPPGVLPLAVLIHGDGHQHTDYHYLMRHLALNGFVAATIDGGTELSNVERAQRLRTYVGFVRDHWTHKAHVANSIALIGHSRGGEAVFTAARKFGEWGLDHDVDALVAIAPTDNDQNGGTEGLESLVGSSSESLLVIYGSRDEDVSGTCTSGTFPWCGVVPTAPARTGFSLFDRAGSEGGTEPFPLYDDVVTKAMLFVDAASHNRWREVSCTFTPGVLSCEAHHDIAKGYLNAFLRWRLGGDDSYRGFFTGLWTPAAVASHGARIRPQYVEGYGRRVVDSFEQPGWSTNSLGGSVTKETQVTVVHDGALYQVPDHTSPHDTRGLVLRWSTQPFLVDPWIRWFVPNGQTSLGARWRDVRGFGYLSLRAGQINASGWNTAGEPQDFTVRLRDVWGGWSPKVRASSVADLAYPEAGFVASLAGSGFFPKSSLQTVRLPLGLFTGVDLEHVAYVELAFGLDEHTQGEIAIDSLQFTD